MSFFSHFERLPTVQANKTVANTATVDLLHRTECKSCPLNRAPGILSPKMKPEGAQRPAIYLIGPAPNERGDKDDRPFAGPELSLIKKYFPRDMWPEVRMGNVIRCHPGLSKEPVKNFNREGPRLSYVRTPTFTETECCRPFNEADIEAAAPDAIFSFGNIALRWGPDETHPNQWQGRRMPVKIGKHVCWWYPFELPIDVIRKRRWDSHVSDDEFAFSLYLKRAVNEVRNGLPKPVVHDVARVKRGVECIDGSGGASDVDRYAEVLGIAVKQRVNGFDIETDRLRPYNKDAKLLSLAIAAKPELAVSIALDHKDAKWSKRHLKEVYDLTYDWLIDKRPIKAVHQLAFEMEWMATMFGRKVLRAGQWADTISQAYIINEMQGMLALEELTRQYFGFNIKALSPNIDRANLANSTLTDLLPYNGFDAKYHLELFFEQEVIVEDEGLVAQYEHQLARIPTLVLTQMEGVPIDQREVKDFRKGFEDEMAEALETLKGLPAVKKFERDNGTYEPGNTHHFAKILKQLGHKLSVTDKGTEETNVKAIAKFKDPVIDATIKWKQAQKALSTYVDAVTPGADTLFEDGKAHPIISTTKVKTWRTSSEDPNIQNWPKRNKNARIRRVVKAREGYKIVSFDFGGIQARNIAMESRDEVLIDSFVKGYDPHGAWAKRLIEMFPDWAPDNWEDPKVFKNLRNGIKNQFVFPTFFGAKPRMATMGVGVGRFGQCDVPEEVLADLQAEVLAQFKGITPWHERLEDDYKRLGYVTGHSGHRRHAPVAYNEMINAPIQADETIIVLTAMTRLSELDYTLYQPMMEIHDDLTFHWPAREVDKRAEVVITEMVKPRFDWIDPVPLLIEMAVGDDWANQKEVGKFENIGRTGRWKEVTT
jgi:DNA polymerase-1